MPKHVASPWATLSGILLLLASCAERDLGEPVHVKKQASFAAPAPDEADALCGDLGDHRVCWSSACPSGACVHPRPLPGALRAVAGAYRCTGLGRERRCEPRERRASAFRCRVGRCVQEQPRLPDDGDWECADIAGVALCRGGSKPAGVAAASVDPGWFCGARRGKAQERVCIDLDPDLPENLGASRCRYELDGSRVRRLCERADSPRVGAACWAAENQCPPGSTCLRGVCLPPRPEPSCWGDFDCERGTCVYGVCMEDGY
jgi:hypothetical protein